MMEDFLEALKLFSILFIAVSLASCAVTLYDHGQLVLGSVSAAGVLTFLAWISR